MIFRYDPGRYANDLKSNGYALLKDVMSDSFLAYLKAWSETATAEAREREDWKISGKKRQFVFDFQSSEDALEFRAGMSRLTGIDEDRFTVSERHLKVYDEAAAPWPAPHKDRAASHISIGLPVSLAEGSTVCVFPNLDRGPNPDERARFLTDRDRPDLASIYQNEHAVMLHEQVGDLVIFLGSDIFHERIRAAGASILYIKVNGEGADPLGENIYARKDNAMATA